MALYNYAQNAKLKVFSQLYVGLKKQGDEKPQLGFATPYEENSAFKKRQVTVDNWCSGYDYVVDEKGNLKRDERGHVVRVKTGPNVKIIDNEPLTGFQITDDIKRVYWGGGNVVWRVLDPRGFELEIQSANLMALIQVSGINEGGIIPGRCLWGRDGAINILLHEKSEEYKNAIMAAEKLKKPKELSVGSRVAGAVYTLHNGHSGIFLGKVQVYVFPYRHYGSSDFESARIVTSDGESGGARVYTRSLKDSGTYDAILIGDTIHLYRKAPLIQREAADIISEEQMRELFSTKRAIFASTSNNDDVIYVAREVHGTLRFTTRSISEKQFKDMLDYVDRVYSTSFSVGNVFYNYRANPRGIMFDGDDRQMWNGSNAIHDRSYFYSTRRVFSPTRWTDNEVRCVQPYDLTYPTPTNNTGVAFEVREVPTFNSKEDMKRWLQTAYEDKRIVEIIVVDSGVAD